MTIERSDIEELSRFESKSPPVVSLYLNIQPLRRIETEINSLAHQALTEMKQADGADKDKVRDLENLFETFKTHLNHLKPLKQTRLVALFADMDGIFKEYLLPLARPSRMVINSNPYTRPLSVLLNEYERYLVLVVDSRKARIFSLYMGMLEAQPDIFIEDEMPDRVGAGDSRRALTTRTGEEVFGGYGAQGIDRYIKEHIHRHLKAVAARVLDHFKEKGFSRLILGGPEDKTLPWIKSHLHSYLKERLAGEFSAQPDDPTPQLKEKALAAAARWERTREDQILRDLFEKSEPQGLAVLGLDPTIKALSLGQVHTLVMNHDFQAEGFICDHDRILSSAEQACPMCGHSMRRTAYLADEMIDSALRQDADIEHVFTEPANFSVYGVGALLRFALQAP